MRAQRPRSILALLCLASPMMVAACAPDAGEEAATPEAAPKVADVAPAAVTGGTCADQPYTVNPDASQDLIESPTGFLRCEAGAYALCYYSGAAPLPCTLDASGENASCQCQIVGATPAAPMYVLMTSILNLCAYTEAVEQCGEDGSGCYNMCNDKPDSPQCKGIELPANQQHAKVCEYIANGTFNPEAAYISTFGFADVSAPLTGDTFGLACNEANGQYAGCMTAPCNQQTLDRNGNAYTTCECPVWPTGGASADYQFGRKCYDSKTGEPNPAENCQLQEGQIWSAAYNPAGCLTKPEPGAEAGP